jgi:hypothetical protein
MTAPTGQTMSMKDLCAPKPGWVGQAELAQYHSAAFKDPVVEFEPTCGNQVARYFNKASECLVVTICCLPCILVALPCIMKNVYQNAKDKSCDEEKAKKKEAAYVAELSENLEDNEWKVIYKTALEKLFYGYMYETDRKRNYFGREVKKAFDAANSSGDPAAGFLAMAQTIDLEINSFIEGLFKTAYQYGAFDLCALCSSIIFRQGCCTFYVGYVSRQHSSYVGSFSEIGNVDFMYPDDDMHVKFQVIRHHLRTTSFMNELALVLKQATLRAASLDLNSFSQKGATGGHEGACAYYLNTQLKPYLESWSNYQFGITAVPSAG